MTKVTYTYLPGTTYTNETYTYKYNSRDQIEEIIATDYSGTLLKTNIEYDYDGWLKAKYIFKNLYGVYYQVSAINYEYTYY